MTWRHRKFFWRRFVSLVNFSYWSKFHVNIIIGSGVMTIFFYKGLTRNLESQIAPFEFCPVSGDLGELGMPNLAWMSLVKCYWMLQNARVTGFTVSELLRENQQERGGGGVHYLPIQMRVKLGTKFQLKLTILTCWTKFCQKGCL